LDITIKNQYLCLKKLCQISSKFLENLANCEFKEIQLFEEKRSYLFQVFQKYDRQIAINNNLSSVEKDEHNKSCQNLFQRLNQIDNIILIKLTVQTKELKQQLIETSQNCKTVKKYRLYGKKTENFVSQSI